MKLKFLWAILPIFFLAGCVTTRQSSDLSQLQVKVSQLEHQIAERDQEIDDLKAEVSDLTGQMDGGGDHETESGESDYKRKSSAATSPSMADDDRIIRVAASAHDVQKALKKAGYYTGTIDGKVGSATRKAIADFQKDHNLKSDGIIGKQTWTELKSYLD